MIEPMFTRTFDEQILAGQLIELDGAEAKHAISVRRMRVGEAIQMSDGHGLRVQGTVQSISGHSMQVLVREINHESLPKLQLHLIQALAKGDRDELAIQAATELGVVGIIPWEAERSVSKWIGIKEEKAVARWQAIVTEAAKQSLRSFCPVVGTPLRSNELIQDFGNYDSVLILDPTAPLGIGSVDLSSVQKLALVVGPEGGISEHELAAFEKVGAIRVHLGLSILRTSTAGIAAIAAILGNSDEWA